jgi:hypothetical protein
MDKRVYGHGTLGLANAARAERPLYWQAYRRGLQRGLYGDDVVVAEEHEAWLTMASSTEDVALERSAGYRDGMSTALKLREYAV